MPASAGLAGTVTLLASAIGGWLGGYLADRIGRVKTLQFTILWFSFFSLVCAFVQNFDQLLIARALLGLGFGGEWAAGAVLMGEAIRPQYRGRAVGSVQSGWAVGWGLAVLSQAILFSWLPPETAWRWMFAIGALPALLVFFLRRYVEEPAIAAATRAKQAASGERPGAAGKSSRARSSRPRSWRRWWRPAARAATTPSPSGCRAFSPPSASCRSSARPAISPR